MLAARCTSEGVRAVNPAAIQGFYAPEEIGDYTDETEAELPPQSNPPPARQTQAQQQSTAALAPPPADAELQPTAPAAKPAPPAANTPPRELPTGATFRAFVDNIKLISKGKSKYYGLRCKDLISQAEAVVICWHTENTLQNALRVDQPEGASGEVLIELTSETTKDPHGALRTIYTVEAMAEVDE
jgi:hypothetical protein